MPFRPKRCEEEEGDLIGWGDRGKPTEAEVQAEAQRRRRGDV